MSQETNEQLLKTGRETIPYIIFIFTVPLLFDLLSRSISTFALITFVLGIVIASIFALGYNWFRQLCFVVSLVIGLIGIAFSIPYFQEQGVSFLTILSASEIITPLASASIFQSQPAKSYTQHRREILRTKSSTAT